eukprot:SAG31_NODE_3119_length_4656_cov_3.057055_1_plen_24_part_10
MDNSLLPWYPVLNLVMVCNILFTS